MEAKKIRTPLGAKLFAFVFVAITVTLVANSYQSLDFMHKQMASSMRATLLQAAGHAATYTRAVMQSTVSQVVLTSGVLSQIPVNRHKDALASLVKSNPLYVSSYSYMGSSENAPALQGSYMRETFDGRYLEAGKVPELKAIMSRASNDVPVWVKSKTHPRVVNLSSQTGYPLLAVSVPFAISGEQDTHIWIVLVMWQEHLLAGMSESGEIGFMVNADGTIVTSTKRTALFSKSDTLYAEVLKAALSSKVAYGVHQWGLDGLGSYYKIPEFDLVSVVLGSQKSISEAIYTVLLRSAYWAALLVLVALALSLLASKSLTKNLKKLQRTTSEITKGNFGETVAVSSRDEVGQLADSINFMSKMIERQIHERIEMARLEQEVKTAQVVQNAFLPRTEDIQDVIRIEGLNAMASECGGDWWSFYKISDRYRLFCIADATGHGLSAALVTAMVSTGTQILSPLLKGHGEVTPAMIKAMLNYLNASLYRSGHGKLTLTLIAAVVDLEKQEVMFANAGHNPPIHIPKEKMNSLANGRSKAKSLMNSGTPMGFYPEVDVTVKSQTLAAGDRLIFYTDGIFEVHNAAGKQWGKRNFRTALEDVGHMPIGDIKQRVVSDLSSHLSGHPIDDDVTMVILEIPETGAQVSDPEANLEESA